MAEFSGFFDAMIDEISGQYDREYIAENFANYFKLFVGNGVFVSPTNQLKINESDGLYVVLEAGWAFINGYWYHNDERRLVAIPQNSSPQPRTDSIVLRWNRVTRDITLIENVGSIDIIRNETIYDLKLAELVVQPFATSVKQIDITDKRSDENVCGFVKGLMEVLKTNDLFNQYKAMFQSWFDDVKGQIQGDMAIKLQTEFTQLNQDVQDYYDASTELLEESKGIVKELTDRDFLIPEQGFVFVENVCNIPNASVTETTILDLYFTKDCINEAMRCVPYIESENGNIKITVSREPKVQLRGTIGVRVR